MNERRYAERVISGEIEVLWRNISYPMCVAAKYYRASDYSDREIKAALRNLIRTKFPDVSDDRLENRVKRAFEVSKKFTLHEIDEINITNRELDVINSLHSNKVIDRNLRKFAFTLLCFAKFESLRGVEDWWINIEWKDLFAAAGLKNITVERQCLMVYELYRSGYIDLTAKIGGRGIRMLGVRDGGAVGIVVTDINECGHIFEEYNGRKFVRCEKCGAMVPAVCGRVKYCRECAGEINREKTRERMRKMVKI